MCFTVNVNIIKEELERRYGTDLIDHDNYRPSYYYHAHSLPDMPVVYKTKSEEKSISLFKWGLIPGWVRSEEEANRIRYMTFNAKAETLSEKPSFSRAFKRSRCIVPVSGFFEWQHIPGRKQPWYIYNPDEPVLSLAGLYDRWSMPGEGNDIYTFSIITTAANQLLAEIHNTKKRMPMILARDNEDKWLESDSTEELANLLRPLPDNILSAHKISPLIGNSRVNRNIPELIEPYTPPEDQPLF
ncbi:MAG TPA: SOS response-associated peptidase [Bacteroidales bacterium]|nr:SOS response-associated peptidase [Bacteroidales bacterium]